MTRLTVPGTPVPLALELYPTSPVQSGMLRDLCTMEGYEPGTWRLFHDVLRPGDTVVDVGAHVGVFSCLAAALVGPTGHVYAFEPDSDNRRQLLRNVALNGFQGRVTIDKRAVAATEGRATFYRCADNDGGHALYDPAKHGANVRTREAPSQRPVTVTTLDACIRQPIRLLKIDVEGAEPLVLRGALQRIREDRPVVVCEVNAMGLQCLGESEQSLRQIMQGLGYREYILADAAPYQTAITPQQTGQQVMQLASGQMAYVVWNILFLPH